MRNFLIIIVFALFYNQAISQNFNWEQVCQVNYPTGIAFDQNDSLWFIVQGEGLFMKLGDTAIDYSSGLITTNVVAISITNGIVWAGGYGGITAFDGTNYTSFDNSTGLNGYSLLDIEADNNGVWIAMESEGASYYDGNSWTHYISNDGITGGYFTTITKDNNGNILLGGTILQNSFPYPGIINIFDNSNWTSVDSTGNMTVKELTKLYKDSQGNIWIGGESIQKFDGNNYTIIMPDTIDISYERVSSMCEDKFGNMWFAINNKGIYMYNGTSIINTNAPSNFSSGKTDGIVKNSLGDVYVCLNSGIYKVDIVTSIKTQNNNKNIKIYPTTFNDKINIKFNDIKKDIHIEIYDLTGKKIISSLYHNLNFITINANKIKKGVYILKINGINKRIIKI